MKYLDEFSDPEIAAGLFADIRRAVTRPWSIMEVCGGQTHAIIRNGIDQLLPPEIELIHGPGCPVCVTPLEMIEAALAIASRPEVTFCSFGDMLRVPGSSGDLFAVKARGGDIRVVYSPLDAVEIAANEPDRQVVFFAVGFETTAPANAMAVFQARERGLTNFSLLVSHVLVPPAIDALMASGTSRVNAFLAAGHVCTVMGIAEYEPLAERFAVPIVVTGFEPLDVLEGIRRAVLQLESGRHVVENAYPRAVRPEGNPVARAMLADVFEVCDRQWRGIGMIPQSGWRLAPAYADFDALQRFELGAVPACEPAACRAGEVLQGLLRPDQCERFGTTCTPRTRWARRWSPAKARARRITSTAGSMPRSRSEGAMADVDDRLTAADIEGWTCPAPLRQHDRIVLGHGGGGLLASELIEHLFLPAFGAAAEAATPTDSAVLALDVGHGRGTRLAFTTDSYVVQPLFFPGGNIGELAVNGTVNDLAMAGARPLALSTGFVLEEGLALDVLGRVAVAMGRAAARAGVQLVTGDTKVVDRRSGDGLFVNTAGIGIVPAGVDLHPARIRPGDAVIVSGEIGLHGIAVLSVREGLEFGTGLLSDTAPLHDLVTEMLAASTGIHALRDCTRGGLAASLCELALTARVGVEYSERSVPVPDEVRAACGFLGLDPIHVANEGKLVAFVAPGDAEAVLASMRAHDLGSAAAIIGTVVDAHPGIVTARTALGASRVVERPVTEQLPRIC